MSKADKMFEGLDYEKEEYDNRIIYSKRNMYGTRFNILFHKEAENIVAYMEYDNRREEDYISMSVHLAIHEKLKELGWIE